MLLQGPSEGTLTLLQLSGTAARSTHGEACFKTGLWFRFFISFLCFFFSSIYNKVPMLYLLFHLPSARFSVPEVHCTAGPLFSELVAELRSPKALAAATVLSQDSKTCSFSYSSSNWTHDKHKFSLLHLFHHGRRKKVAVIEWQK